MNKQINGEKGQIFPYNRMTTNTFRRNNESGKSPFGSHWSKKLKLMS